MAPPQPRFSLLTKFHFKPTESFTSPHYEPFWIQLPDRNRFYCTLAYMQGVYDMQRAQPMRPIAPHGMLFAHYNNGYHNEKQGYHDNIDGFDVQLSYVERFLFQ